MLLWPDDLRVSSPSLVVGWRSPSSSALVACALVPTSFAEASLSSLRGFASAPAVIATASPKACKGSRKGLPVIMCDDKGAFATCEPPMTVVMYSPPSPFTRLHSLGALEDETDAFSLALSSNGQPKPPAQLPRRALRGSPWLLPPAVAAHSYLAAALAASASASAVVREKAALVDSIAPASPRAHTADACAAHRIVAGARTRATLDRVLGVAAMLAIALTLEATSATLSRAFGANRAAQTALLSWVGSCIPAGVKLNVAPPTWKSDEESSEEDVAATEEEETRAPADLLVFHIDSFSKQKKPKIYSESKTLGEYKWRLMVFPRGNKTDLFLGAYVEICNAAELKPGWQLHARFMIEATNHVDSLNTLRHECAHTFNAREMDWGWQTFVRLTELTDKSSGFIKDDGVTLVASMEKLPDPPAFGSSSMYDSRNETGYVGLRNQGATCYMNSLLEALYHTTALTSAVFQLPTDTDEPTKSMPLALQRVFFGLKYSPKAVSTKELTKSFGWDTYESFTQHDVQELNRVLCDNLESKMKGTPAEGTIQKLFCGKVKNFIKCLDIEFESSREEQFYDLALNVKDCKDIYASFDKYTETETLDGDNKYAAEGHGLQRARKGTTFMEFPQVLHLQLKRWEYDPMRDSMVKVNDRFEFPVTLDLERYLDESAPRVPCTYQLHAVLIHSGDVNGGHYYVFCRPKQANAWYRFDDERVSKVRLREIFEESYGGDKEFAYHDGFGRKITSFTKRFTNAYMLVYVRVQDIPNVMFKLRSKSIPLHLHKRFASDMEATENRERERLEASQVLSVKVVSEDTMRKHKNRNDLVDWDTVDELRVKRTSKMKEVRAVVAQHFGVHPLRVRMWSFTMRQNNTIRPDELLPMSVDDKSVEAFLFQKKPELRLFAEVAPKDVPANFEGTDKEVATLLSQFWPQPTQDEVMLFVKEYVPLENTLRFVGRAFLRKDTKGATAMNYARMLAGIPDNDPVAVYEEVRRELVPPLCLSKTLNESEIGNGDILIIQRVVELPEKPVPEKFLTAPEFLTFLHISVTVRFRDYAKYKEGEAKEDAFKLPMTKKTTYDVIVERAAAALGEGVQPTHIRLWPSSYSDVPGYEPVKRSPDLCLQEMLRTYYGNEMVNNLLFYEVLQVPLSEIENKKEIKLTWRGFDFAKESHTFLLPKDSCVAEALEKVRELHPPQPGGSGRYRLLELFNSRVYREIDAETTVASLTVFSSPTNFLIAEEMAKEEAEVQPSQCRLSVVHCSTDSNGNAEMFGDPFFFVVEKGATLAEVKPLLQKRLAVPDEEFAKWKFASVMHMKPAFIGDKEVVSERVRVTTGGWGSEFLGMFHADTTPRSKKGKELGSYRYTERSIKIKG
eukprot:m51a1_g4062 hypothetical protein (1362) ;mRNA; f:735008-740750